MQIYLTVCKKAKVYALYQNDILNPSKVDCSSEMFRTVFFIKKVSFIALSNYNKYMIHLVELDKYNTWDVMFLKIRRDQKRFIADNVWSMLHAYTGNKTKGAVYPFGIYNDKKPVGFLLVAYDYSEVCDDPDAPEISKNNYFLWRLMIDKRYQGRGYGREAVKLALDFIKTFPHGKAEYCWICYDKENEVARKLYLSMGFEEIGEQGSDINAVIKL